MSKLVSVTTELASAPVAGSSVFISYSRQNLDFVDALQSALIQRGFDAKVDRSDIEAGEAWWSRIVQLISEADAIVFVLSPHSIISPTCKKEIEFAETLNKRLIPIVAQDITSLTVPDALARINYIFFIPHPPSGISGEFESSVTQLVNVLENHLPWVREHTRLGVLAARWAQRDRASELLLRGGELASAEAWIATRPPKAPDPSDAHRAFLVASRQAAIVRQRWWLGGSMAIALGALFLAGWAYLQALEADRQRRAAEFQRLEAKKNAERAIEARDAALITQSKFLAPRALQATAEGNAAAGALIALESLPDGGLSREIEHTRPLWPESAVALEDAMRSLVEDRVVGGIYGSSPVQLLMRSRRILWRQAFGDAWLTDYEGQRVGAAFSKPTTSVQEIAVSPNETRALVCYSDGSCGVWDLERSIELAQITEHLAGRTDRYYSLYSAAVSSDSTLAAFAVQSGHVHIVGLDTGRLHRTIDASSKLVSSIAFQPGGNVIAIATHDAVSLWDMGAGQLMREFPGQETIGEGLQFSEDGQLLVSFGRSVRILDTALGTEIAKLGFSSGSAVKALLSSDTLTLVAGSDRGSIRIWRRPDRESKTWDLKATRTEHARAVESLALSSDSRWLASGSEDGTLRLWGLPTGKIEAVFKGHGSDVPVVQFMDNDQTVVSFSFDGTVRWWSLPDQEIAGVERGLGATIVSGHDDAIHSMEVSKDGKRLLTRDMDGVAIVWDLGPEPNSPKRLQRGEWESAAYIGAAKFLDHHGQRVVAGSEEYGVEVWDVNAERVLRTLVQPGTQIESIDVSDDGTRVIVFFRGGRVELFLLDAELQIVSSKTVFESERPEAPAFLDQNAIFVDEERVVIARAADEIVVASAASADILHTLRPDDAMIFVAEVSNNGAHLLSADGNRQAALWDLKTGQKVRSFECKDILSGAAFTPDSRTVVLRCRDGSLDFWSVPEGLRLGSIKHHGGKILAAADTLLLIGSGNPFEDRAFTLHGWSVPEGVEQFRLRGHKGAIEAASFLDPTGAILSVSSDRSIRYWPKLPRGEALVSLAQERTPRCLTQSERRTHFLSDEPPRWCITGRVDGSGAWRPKWPYQSAAWRNWLLARDRGETPAIPEP
ncbi:MAG: TIR domain-containing protein [Hyphomicrobium sp.]|nr:TIR domain-containing protein [Hyphomicrobium sp.]